MFTLQLSATASNNRQTENGQEHRLRTPFGHLYAFVDGPDPASAFHDDGSSWVLVSGFTVNLKDVLHTFPALEAIEASGVAMSMAAQLAWIYRCEGFNGLSRLEGCFALCLVDRNDGTIHVLRDRLGGRRAYVHIGRDQIMVASHAHRIAAHPNVQADENPDHLALRVAYAGFPVPGTTPFRNIDEVLPGEHWRIHKGQVRRNRQALDIPARFLNLGLSEAIETLASGLERSVTGHTAGQRSVATMLSGGLDSTPATALMAGHLAGRSARLRAISWSLPGARVADETERIQETSRMLGIDLRLFNGRDCIPFSKLSTNDINPGSIEFNAFRPLLDQAMQLACDDQCDAIANFSAGDFIYPPSAYALTGMLRGHEWTQALLLITRVMGTWSRGRRPWRSPPLRGHIRNLITSDRERHPFVYRLEFLTEAAQKRLPPLPSPFTEARTHPVPAYARFLQTAMAYHRAEESYFAERLGLRYLDPYQSEELARTMLALPFSYSYRNQQSKWIMRQLARGLIPERIRTTTRTGNLLGFLKFGYRTHHDRIVDLIGAQRPHWREVLREERVDKLLAEPRPSEAALVLICQLIGYSLWCRAWK